jgi:exodeoxyribonuclease V alpha subunit
MDAIQLSSLDHYFADYITRVEGQSRDGLWLAAALVSAVSCRGSVCLDLLAASEWVIIPFIPESGSQQAPSAECWQKQLAGCKTVGTPGDYTPLVLDGSGRLYLHRSWDYERRVGDEIVARSAPLSIDTSRVTAALDRYFPLTGDEGDLQREAAQAALSRRFTVISGGPGTGKTSTVARILALLIELSEISPPEIQLAAPTGKAAMRLKESIRNALDILPLLDEVRAVMPQEVTTIHRLLGVVPGQSGFRFNRDNQLSCDVMVIDEASMIDLPLLARLLEALRSDAQVILLGDRDQLASVEAGAVMSDICSGSADGVSPSADRPAIVQLKKSYRFNNKSGIGRLSHLINAGDGAGALALLNSGQYGDVCWRTLPPAGNFAETFKMAAAEGFSEFSKTDSPGDALVALERFRILAPHREGRYGVVTLNRLAASALSHSRHETLSDIHLMPVMLTVNNYDLELYNGDTGVILGTQADGESKTVYFPAQDSMLRRFSLLRLPPHETAFALTVHKSQGSEFDTVLLILPDQLSDVLSRELIYTAVTRARTGLEIWGEEEVFCRAVERCIERRSGLVDRLWKTGGA